LLGRRYKQLLATFAAEIGGELTAIDMALLGQAAALVVRSEIIQTAIIAGESADTDEVIRLSSEGVISASLQQQTDACRLRLRPHHRY
jgi:hypothetical protein